ncbi:BEN domain-containing protein 5 [Grus japonensis]|uniref:BEN domain-containing protein 5 n=1 Tax=Grus japonensis TaxID=30415 RepID=A0ABC9X823_GRUJA
MTLFIFGKGNLGRVDHITEFEYDLFIRPDTCNPRFRVWFNFTVENVKESQLLNSCPVSTPLDRNSCKFQESRLPDGQETPVVFPLAERL